MKMKMLGTMSCRSYNPHLPAFIKEPKLDSHQLSVQCARAIISLGFVLDVCTGVQK